MIVGKTQNCFPLLITLISPKVMDLLAKHLQDIPKMIGSGRSMTFCDHDDSSSESELGDIVVTAKSGDDD